MPNISDMERRIRQKASYDHQQKVRKAFEELTSKCYYGNNIVPRLTMRFEKQNDDGTITIENRPPTIQEVSQILAAAVFNFERENVEAQAVNKFVNDHFDKS